MKKDTPTQVLSCDFCKSFNNTYFYWTFPVAASGTEQQILLVLLVYKIQNDTTKNIYTIKSPHLFQKNVL